MRIVKIKLSNKEKLGLIVQGRQGFGVMIFCLCVIIIGTIVFLANVFEQIKYSSLEQVKDTAIIKDIFQKYDSEGEYYEYFYEFVVDSKKYQNSFQLHELSFNKNDKINISYPINHPNHSKREGSGLSFSVIVFIIAILGILIVGSFFYLRKHYNYMQKVVLILENGIMIEAIQKEKTITENDNDGTIFLTYHLVFEYHVLEDKIKKYFFDIEEYDYKEKSYKEVEQIVYSVSNPNLAILVKELPYSTYIEDRISKKTKFQKQKEAVSKVDSLFFNI